MRKLLTILICLSLLFNLLPQIALPTAATYEEDSESTSVDSVEIWTPAELIAIGDNLSGNYSLMCDLDVSGYNWSPIGTTAEPFCGIFSGNGHTIFGLTIDESNPLSDRFGLFGSVSGATIKDLSLSNVKITIAGASAASGIIHVGCIAGYANSTTIDNCTAQSEIQVTTTQRFHLANIVGTLGDGNSTIHLCIGYGSISGDSTATTSGITGGVVAYSNPKNNSVIELSCCANYASLSAKTCGQAHCGGIIGYQSPYYSSVFRTSLSYNHGSVYAYTSSSSEGTYAGGIVGYCDAFESASSYISDCYNAGSVYGSKRAGGICQRSFIGRVWNASYASGKTVEFKNCYNVGTITGSNTKPIVNSNQSCTFSKCYYLNTTGSDSYGTSLTSTQMQTASNFSGYDFTSTWEYGGGEEYPHPTLRWEAYNGCRHIWGDAIVLKVATCTKGGQAAYTCTKCGETRALPRDPLGHKFENGICTLCGKQMAFYYSGLTDPIPVNYTDSYFSPSSYEYNHNLAWLSLCLELSSFSTNEDKYWGKPEEGASEEEKLFIEKARTENIRDAYQLLGFSNVKIFNYNKSLNDTSDKIAYAIAEKRLPDGNTLISIVVRGGGYGCEWSSNMNVGTGEYHHDGFYNAMLEVYSSVKTRIASVGGPCTLWITGYSRGAAVANLLAARLDDDSMTNSQTSADRIFAYTFATPQGVTKAIGPSDERYNNIFNIVNPGDAVPNVAPSGWGFARYGVTKKFMCISAPSVSLIASPAYQQYVDNINANLKKYNVIKEIEDDAVTYYSYYDASHSSTILAVMKLIQKAFPSCATAIPMQEALSDFLEIRFSKSLDPKKGWVELSSHDGFSLMKEKYGDVFVQAFADSLVWISNDELLKNLDASTKWDIAMFLALCDVHGYPSSKADQLVADLINIKYIPSVVDVISTYKEIGLSHMPGVYLAWMDQNEESVFENGSSHSWTVSLHCPIDITVYNTEGICVAQITNHQVVFSDIPVLIDGESTEFFFNESPDTYRIAIIPTDEGTMTYCVTELDENQELVRRTSYLDVTVEPSQVYSGEILATEEYVEGMYDLTCIQDGTETVISADEILTENIEVQITVEETEGGTTSGSGCYFRGDTVTLRAYPNDDYEFTGWFQDGLLLYDEATFRIELLEDTAIQAVFSPTTCEHIWEKQTVIDIPSIDDALYLGYCCEKCGKTRTGIYDTCTFTDVKIGKYYYKSVLWATLEEITSGTSKTMFSPDKTCTREQVVTFLWRANGCEEPTSTENPFKDVPADAYYTKAVLWAVEKGVTNGKSKTKFGVGQPCTREQVVTFLWRAEGMPEHETVENPFKDVSETAYSYHAILWAVENGITNGTSKTKFSPAKTCTRGQIVTFLYRCMV